MKGFIFDAQPKFAFESKNKIKVIVIQRAIVFFSFTKELPSSEDLLLLA
jgi:hypothetical protein